MRLKKLIPLILNLTIKYAIQTGKIMANDASKTYRHFRTPVAFGTMPTIALNSINYLLIQ